MTVVDGWQQRQKSAEYQGSTWEAMTSDHLHGWNADDNSPSPTGLPYATAGQIRGGILDG